MAPGSDTANLSVMGYDPRRYYTGRSPLEALSIGVDMKDTDVVYRCNLVTLTEEDAPYEEQTILDHSSDEISTEDAAVLLRDVCRELENETYRFYTGTSYRHCLVWGQRAGAGTDAAPTMFLRERSGEYLPHDETLLYMQKRSYEILKNHPLNIRRKEQGLNPANSFWFWGAEPSRSLLLSKISTTKKALMISRRRSSERHRRRSGDG